MERLYYKIRTKDGGKWYRPIITCRGRHNTKVYSRAQDAQDHSLSVRSRYKRLRAAEIKIKQEAIQP